MGGMFDDAKGKMGGMTDKMREQYEKLQNREREGNLDDKGRSKLEELRKRFGK